jgi:hypothetical protein
MNKYHNKFLLKINIFFVRQRAAPLVLVMLSIVCYLCVQN